MNKFCVFCGKKPDAKNKEHIIAQWLIELTGKPKRLAYFGLEKNFNKKIKKRIFAFDQFTFPSCTDCNSKFSELENNTKYILEKILEKEKISAGEVSLFLDWMDKIRIGLWLGFIQLDKNYAGIEPKFYIESRIGKYDRLLEISKSDFNGKRLNFCGIDTYSFALTPSAFQIIVNNYYFTNISYNFLFSRRIGFPYPIEVYISPDNYKMEAVLTYGKERIMRPLINKPINEPYIEIFQPMIPSEIKDECVDYYSTQYVKEHCLDFEKGIGNIFKVENGNITEFKKGDKLSLEPTSLQNENDFLMESAIQVFEWQNWLNERPVNYDKLSREKKTICKSQRRFGNRMNNRFIKHIRSQMD